MYGFLNINKPSGCSSHKVISVLRKITGIKKIGHGGTLDPLASGVLPVAIGKATSLIDYLPSDKRYIACLELGKRSDTYDIEGNVEYTNSEPVNKNKIEETIKEFRGEINQMPPAFSAVHYNGKRLYELARIGKIPNDIPSRTVTIYKNEIVDFNEINQTLKLDITCSKGTYIRTIVNDIGEMLGTGAVMTELTRVEAGGMELKSAIDINENLTKDYIQKKLINPIEIIHFPIIEITEEEYQKIIHGNKINNKYKEINNVFLNYKNNMVALAKAEKDFIQPKKIMIL